MRGFMIDKSDATSSDQQKRHSAQALYALVLKIQKDSLLPSVQKKIVSFNFPVGLDQQQATQHAWSQIRGDVVKNRQAAITTSDLEKLSVYLGPAIFALQQRYNETHLRNFRLWKNFQHKEQFYDKQLNLVKWFSRKRTFQKLWSNFEKTQSHTKQYAELKGIYEQAMQAYQERGLSAYIQVMAPNAHAFEAKHEEQAASAAAQKLREFFIAQWDATAADTMFRLNDGVLSGEEASLLKKILQQEFAAPNQPYRPDVLQQTQIVLHPANHRDNASDQKHFQSEDSAPVSSLVLPFRRNDLADEKHNQTLTQNGLWQREHDLVSTQKNPEAEQAWMDEILKAIDDEGYLPTIIETLQKNHDNQAIERCVGIYNEQERNQKKYRADRAQLINEYRITALAWLGTHDSSRSTAEHQQFIASMIESGIGEVAFDTAEMLWNSQLNNPQNLQLGNPLLHEAQLRCVQTNGQNALNIVLFLIERGASPTSQNVRGQDANTYAPLRVRTAVLAIDTAVRKALVVATPEQQRARRILNQAADANSAMKLLNALWYVKFSSWLNPKRMIQDVRQKMAGVDTEIHHLLSVLTGAVYSVQSTPELAAVSQQGLTYFWQASPSNALEEAGSIELDSMNADVNTRLLGNSTTYGSGGTR